MQMEFDLQSSRIMTSKRCFDLTLYFRSIQVKHEKKITCVQIYKDWLYLGTADFQVYVYQIRQNQDTTMPMELHNERVFSSHCTDVKSIVASEQLLIVIPNKQQQLIRIWKRDSLQISRVYFGHESQISSAIFLEDGLHIASCGFDKTVRIWSICDQVLTDREITQYKGKFPLLTLVQLTQNTLAFAGDDCYITVWNWIQDQVRYKCYAHLGTVMSLQTCNNFLYSVGGDSKVKAWAIQKFDKTAKYLTKVKQHKKRINQQVFTIKISTHEILTIDSKGHTYLMNDRLGLGSSKLKIDYTQTIKSVKIWQNRLFIVLRSEQKAELKQILVDLDELRYNAQKTFILPQLHSIKTTQNVQIKLLWRKLGLSERKTGSIVLKDLNGYFESGDFVTIMGASGAGKSSLLSIIGCRLTEQNRKLRIQGDFLINGEIYDLKDYSRIAAYVQQEDILFGALTVRQTFQFHAQLKMWKYSKQQQKQRCSKLLTKLNLQECSESLVGNSIVQKSISGGQKKRLSIGIQLISNPKILIFDEPTLGLDSHNALIIVRQLAKLARQQNILVIASIHQPSTLIFQQMDHLYLLKKGMCVYNGKANNIINYMEKLGIPINIHMNPADLFMFEISTFRQNQGYRSPLNVDNCQKNTVFRAKFFELQSQKHKGEKQVRQTSSFSQQYFPLLQRGFKSVYRTPSNIINKLVTAFIIPTFLGLLYHDIGSSVPQSFDQIFLFNFFCYIFMAQYFIFSMNVYETVLIFPNEKQIILRQAKNNLYSIPTYYLAKVSSEILGCIIPAIISGVLVYLAGNMNLSPKHFGLYISIYILLALIGFFFGLMYGVLNKNSQKAIPLLAIVLIPILIYGGLAVNINDIPVYARWLQYLSPIRHSFALIFQDQITTKSFIQFKQGRNLPLNYGLDEDPAIALGCLFGILGVLIGLSLLFLMRVKRSQ